MNNSLNIVNDTADVAPVPRSDSEIFSNELILEHIFRHLTVTDLKHCRGVNILWCLEATKSLLQNHELSPILIENNGYCTRIRIRSKDSILLPGLWIPEECLMDPDDFMAMVSASISFPCNNISFRTDASKNTTIQFFLNNYGGNIQELEICMDLVVYDNYYGDIDDYKELEGRIVKIIEDLLTKQVTKLQCLKIQERSFTISPSMEFLNDVKLNNLTKLIVGEMCTSKSNEFMGIILNAAVNLKIVTSDHANGVMPSDMLKAIVAFGKAHLLDHCNFSIDFSSNIEEQINVYEAVVSSQPKLKTLSLGLKRCYSESEAYAPLLRLASIISKCLELNSENLVDIHGIDNLLRLPGIRIPRLPKVKSLDSRMYPLKLMEGNLLPLSFAETFPNLKSIAFFYDFWSTVVVEEVCNYLENVIPCLNVTHCDYGNDFVSLPPTLFEYFGEKFPNLTHLTFEPIVEFLEASQHIWSKLTQLEFLEILIGSTSASVEANYPGLEAAFTGFSSETCLRLNDCVTEGKDVNVEFSNLEELRINPSILDLKKLTCLKLIFKNKQTLPIPGFWKNWDPASPILTAVTGQFAFALCPSLQADIKIEADEGFPNTWSDECNPFLGVKPFLNKMTLVIF